MKGIDPIRKRIFPRLFRKAERAISSLRTLMRRDVIRMRGEVETVLFPPEYEKQVEAALIHDWKIKDNWTADNGRAPGYQRNTIDDGYLLCAGLAAFHDMEGIRAVDNAIQWTDLGLPTRFLGKPDAVAIYDGTNTFMWWLRASFAYECDATARFLAILPTDLNHVDGTVWTGPPHPHVGHGLDDCNMTIQNLLLCGPEYRRVYGPGGLTLDATPAKFNADMATDHIASMDWLVGETALAGLGQIGIGYDYTIDADRHNITITNPGTITANANFIAAMNTLPLDLFANPGPASMNVFAQRPLTDYIAKTNQFMLAISWKISII